MPGGPPRAEFHALHYERLQSCGDWPTAWRLVIRRRSSQQSASGNKRPLNVTPTTEECRVNGVAHRGADTIRQTEIFEGWQRAAVERSDQVGAAIVSDLSGAEVERLELRQPSRRLRGRTC